jgi:hypothetical protein
MTTKKLLLTGFGPEVTEAGVRDWLSSYGQVVRVDIIRDGNAADPLVLVEMAIGDGTAAYLLSRLSDYWHAGALINARLLNH